MELRVEGDMRQSPFSQFPESCKDAWAMTQPSMSNWVGRFPNHARSSPESWARAWLIPAATGFDAALGPSSLESYREEMVYSSWFP